MASNGWHYGYPGQMEKKIMFPIQPGEILMKEFLQPMGITQYRLAKDISVAPRRINKMGYPVPLSPGTNGFFLTT
jgi:hypothetical protein